MDFIKKKLPWWVLVAAIFFVGIWYVNNHDVPGIGDSHIAFTMKDGRQWTKNFYAKDVNVEWTDINGAIIINPSPQSCMLELTNTDTGQVFTVRHRDSLSGDHYKVVKRTNDGKAVSVHYLKVYH